MDSTRRMPAPSHSVCRREDCLDSGGGLHCRLLSLSSSPVVALCFWGGLSGALVTSCSSEPNPYGGLPPLSEPCGPMTVEGPDDSSDPGAGAMDGGDGTDTADDGEESVLDD